MGDDFNAMRKAGQEKRARNRESSARLLEARGIRFESKNHGAHLVVEGRIDFWPGTGKWIERGSNKKGRGVKGVIARASADQGRAETTRIRGEDG